MHALALTFDVKRLRRFALHAKCKFERGDPRVESAVDDALLPVNLIQPAERVQLCTLALPNERAMGKDAAEIKET